jgi:hypothetical protein
MHAMIDIESLSLHPMMAWILSIGLVKFHPARKQGTFFSTRLWNLAEPNQEGMTPAISRDTLDWWLQQDELARMELVESPKTEYKIAFQELMDEIKDCVSVWARGPQFDLLNIWNQAGGMGILLPVDMKNWRDSRTLSDWYGYEAYEEFVDTHCKSFNRTKHSAVDDAAIEAAFVQHCWSLQPVPGIE